mmetsp:Transcript_16064/g.46244  ORF Transcript_16064/g.46244 Transcript_16064/m.46244 type:complete len:86 (-) Transcript_16064:115-372(-)
MAGLPGSVAPNMPGRRKPVNAAADQIGATLNKSTGRKVEMNMVGDVFVGLLREAAIRDIMQLRFSFATKKSAPRSDVLGLTETDG